MICEFLKIYITDLNNKMQQYAVCLWRELEKPTEAEQLLRKALEITPTCASSRTLLATMLQRHNGTREAQEESLKLVQEEYEKALEYSAKEYAVVPPFIFQRYCHFLLGANHASEDKVELADSLYKRAIALHPQHVGLLTDSARCNYLVKDSREEARVLLERAYALQPHQGSVVLAYAQFTDVVDGAGPKSAQVEILERLLPLKFPTSLDDSADL